MKTFAVYKGIKSHLNSIAQVLYYTGQYSKDKGNTSYVAPVIYIEMPKTLKVDYFPGGVKVAKGAEIRIHYLSNAPFQGHDNTVQDSAVQAHETTVADIMEELEGLEIKDSSGRVIASGLIHTGSTPVAYRLMYAFSVLIFKCELRDYSVRKYTENLPEDAGGLEVTLG